MKLRTPFAVMPHRRHVPLTGLFLCSILWAIAPTSTLAEESCAFRAAKFIEEGKGTVLASWFKAPTSDVARELNALIEEIGPLKDATALPKKKSGPSWRRSVRSKDLPTHYAFAGSWAEALSEKHGLLQIQASAELGSDCRLLALHIDWPAKR